MNVLITGGAGFIGSNLAKRFISDGHDVTILDSLVRRGTGLNLEWLRTFGEFSFVRGDIRDARLLDSLFKQNKPFDVVIHQAAQVAVTTSVLDPRDDFETNAAGTFKLLEAVRASRQLPLFLLASTNKVYGELSDVGVCEKDGMYQYTDKVHGISEEQNLDFHSPYGCSKGTADQYAHDYSRIYDIPTVVFRQSCIYGPRQFGLEDQGWVAWFIIATVLGKPITIYGDGKQVRDILYIDDLCDLYLKAIARIDRVKGQVFNVGGGPVNQASLIQVLDYLGELLGRKIELTFSDWRPGDQKVFVTDTRKVQREVGWAPRVPMKEGIACLLAWVKEHRQMIDSVLSPERPARRSVPVPDLSNVLQPV